MSCLILTRDERIWKHWKGVLLAGEQAMQRVSNAPDSGFPGGDDSQLLLLDLVADPERYQPRWLISIMKNNPGFSCFVLSAKPGPEEGLAWVEAGARGYGNRLMHPDVQSQAVQLVQGGEIWLGSELILHLIRQAQPSVAEDRPPAADSLPDTLTQREREIALLVGQGLNNKQIARELDITDRTVKAHLGAVFKKTGVSDRLQLALLVNQQA